MERVSKYKFDQMPLEQKVEYSKTILYPDGTDFVECAICGLRSRDLVSHVTRIHKIKGADYKERFESPLVSKGLSKFKSEKILGENNPGFQHGGKFSPWSKKSEFYSEESKNKAVQNRTSITQLDWWIERGFTEEDYRNFQSTRLENKTIEEKLEIRRSKQLTWFENGNAIHPDDKDDYYAYRSLCWFFTNLNDLTKLDGYEKRGRLDEDENAFHLDHKISICFGFNNNIPPEVIGDISNLRFIPGTENVRKGAKCV